MSFAMRHGYINEGKAIFVLSGFIIEEVLLEPDFGLLNFKMYHEQLVMRLEVKQGCLDLFLCHFANLALIYCLILLAK